MEGLLLIDHVTMNEPLKLSMVERIMTPKEGHILIFETCEHVTLFNKREF